MLFTDAPAYPSVENAPNWAGIYLFGICYAYLCMAEG